MKRENLKKSGSEILVPTLYPYTGPQIFQGIRVALSQSLGFVPSFARLGRIIGQKTNLTHYWFSVLRHQHLIAFLRLLERLPERKRVEFLRQYCRELPRLDHPRVAHDPAAVSNLEALLRRGTGLTWIQGGTQFQRTWVMTALGHSFPFVVGEHGTVGGLDVHEPRKWVPIETVVYLKEPSPRQKVKEMALDAWPAVHGSKPDLFLFNGIWLLAPELHERILGLTMEHHVILSVPKLPEAAGIGLTVPTHVVSLSSSRDRDEWILVEVETLQS